MEKIPFKLETTYEPSGDQPQAIEKMVEGLNEGLAHQTLLGVTGSGKSVGYDDTLVIAEAVGGEMRTRRVKAGPFIDALIEAHGLDVTSQTEQYACADRAFLTLAYDPLQGKTAWYPVAALLRHRTPGQMFCLTTRCGRAVQATGDHNFWVLRDGVPTLINTADARLTDFLPVPDTISASAHQFRAPLEYRTVGGAAYVSVPAELEVADYERLPEYWPDLSDQQLGLLLRAYFDRKGEVGIAGKVRLTTHNGELASDVAYALKRFGIRPFGSPWGCHFRPLRPRSIRATCWIR